MSSSDFTEFNMAEKNFSSSISISSSAAAAETEKKRVAFLWVAEAKHALNKDRIKDYLTHDD